MFVMAFWVRSVGIGAVGGQSGRSGQSPKSANPSTIRHSCSSGDPGKMYRYIRNTNHMTCLRPDGSFPSGRRTPQGPLIAIRTGDQVSITYFHTIRLVYSYQIYYDYAVVYHRYRLCARRVSTCMEKSMGKDIRNTTSPGSY